MHFQKILLMVENGTYMHVYVYIYDAYMYMTYFLRILLSFSIVRTLFYQNNVDVKKLFFFLRI